MRHSNSIQNSFSLSKNNVFLYWTCLYRNWHLCNEVDCIDILYVPKLIVPILTFNVSKLDLPKKRTASVCTEIVLYRKWPTPHANLKRWNDETTRGHWQQFRRHSNVLALQYHKNNIAFAPQVITRHVFTLGQTSIISSQFIHKHLRKSHQICL